MAPIGSWECVRTSLLGMKRFVSENKRCMYFLFFKTYFWFTNHTSKWKDCQVDSIGTASLFPFGNSIYHLHFAEIGTASGVSLLGHLWVSSSLHLRSKLSWFLFKNTISEQPLSIREIALLMDRGWLHGLMGDEWLKKVNIFNISVKFRSQYEIHPQN